MNAVSLILIQNYIEILNYLEDQFNITTFSVVDVVKLQKFDVKTAQESLAPNLSSNFH